MVRNLTNIIFFVLFMIFSSYNSLASSNKTNANPNKIKTIVIDPGHGGKHPGTIRNGVEEKDITLKVALKVGELIQKNHKDVKVIYTRKNDKFIGLSERADIANKNSADLFISIHVNSINGSAANGVETFVMGMDKSASNMAVCQLENSVITLEDDYTSSYSGFDPNNPESYIIFSLLQNSHLEQSLLLAEHVQRELVRGPIKKNRGVKQAPFLVLWKCTMPSILIELGFLSNYSDFKHLTSTNSLNQMAQRISSAFTNYKRAYDKNLNLPTAESNSRASNETIKDNKGHTNNHNKEYRIQIFATSKVLASNSKEFKGHKCEYIKSGKFYKYTVGRYGSREEANRNLAKIKKDFPSAYIIEVK